MKREEMQRLVNEYFSKLGNRDIAVNVRIINDPRIIAGARGVKLPVLNIPFGEIYINEQLNHMLTDDELKFVLAHEVVHIDQNHLPFAVLLKLPRIILKELGKEYLAACGLSLLWELIRMWIYLQGELPPEAAITKQQELQADIWAIFLTGNKSAAISCLKKLVNNDLSKPSHLWEILDVKLPVMTMYERISRILDVISQYEIQGYKFK